MQTIVEKTYRHEEEARDARRTLINSGQEVSLIAYDPARDLYAFDLYFSA